MSQTRFFCILIAVVCTMLRTGAAEAQWVQTNGPNGGWVYCITPFGNDIFIGTQNGVFESTDSGSHWIRKSNGLPNSSIYSIATCGGDLFAGTDAAGVFRSTDQGLTWDSASSGLPPGFTVLTMTSNNKALFIPNGSNSYFSTNDGNDWELVDVNLTKVSEPQAALIFDSATYLVGNWITKTTDNGMNWSVVAIPPADSQWDIVAMVNIGEVLFDINYANSLPYPELSRSTDNGQTWISANNGLPYDDVQYLGTMGQELFAASNGAVYRSSDSGRTWQSSSSGFPTGIVINSIASYDNVLFAGIYGLGMYRSFDSGITWMQCNQGLGGLSINVIANNGDTIVAGTNAGLFLSADNGATWQARRNGMANYNIQSILAGEGNLFVGTEGGRYNPSLFESTNSGQDWVADTLINGYNFGALIRSGSNLIAGGSPDSYGGLYSSTDNGLSWKNCGMTFDYSVIAVNGIVKIGSTLVASTNAGPGISIDNGLTWQSFHEGIVDVQRFAVSAIGATDSEVFIACIPFYYTGNLGVFLSEDEGNIWHPALDTLFPLRGVVQSFASFGNNMFAATDSLGIFLTTDNGTHWTNENLGLVDSNVISLEVQGNELLAGTATSGVWRRPLAEMIPSATVAIGKQRAVTISVYPDPASSMVTVSCPDIVGTTEVSLISETGATVWRRTITTNGQPFQLDLTGVANGAYRLELNAGGVSRSSKIVLEQ